MMSDSLSIVLVDRHLLFLDALSARLNRTDDLRVVGTAGNGEQALQSVLSNVPDVAVMDVELPGRGPFDVIRELTKQGLQTRILLLADRVADVLIDRALRLNVAGYLTKNEAFETLKNCIRLVGAGKRCFSAVVKKRLRVDSDGRSYVPGTATSLSTLTERQLEVLRYLAEGCSIKEIARSMCLSAKSVDSHRYRIARKLGIHNRVALARFAYREGLVAP